MYLTFYARIPNNIFIIVLRHKHLQRLLRRPLVTAESRNLKPNQAFAYNIKRIHFRYMIVMTVYFFFLYAVVQGTSHQLDEASARHEAEGEGRVQGIKHRTHGASQGTITARTKRQQLVTRVRGARCGGGERGAWPVIKFFVILGVISFGLYLRGRRGVCGLITFSRFCY